MFLPPLRTRIFFLVMVLFEENLNFFSACMNMVVPSLGMIECFFFVKVLFEDSHEFICSLYGIMTLQFGCNFRNCLIYVYTNS